MISVALCSYNGEKYIEEQLDSIINQTVKPDEIIVVDDCSSDSTVSIAQKVLSLSGINYRIISNETNLRVFYSFQKCINECTGDIIFTADQDDVWDKTKIEKFMVCFNDPDCIMAFSDGKIVDKDLNVINESVWDSLNLKRAGLSGDVTQEKLQRMLMYYWVVPGTMMAFRKKLSDVVFPIPEDGGYIHDSWLSINAPYFGNVAVIDEPLTLYRQHGNNSVGAPVYKRDKKEQNMTQIKKVLFYLKRHYDRLGVFVGSSDNYKDNDYNYNQDYKKIVKEYMGIYKKWAYYEKSSKLAKLLFILKRIIDNKMKMFDVSRKELIQYLFH